MAVINRRRFVERLGLGAGALFLAPVAQSLVNQAHGQVKPRKRLIVVTYSNGGQAETHTPIEFKAKFRSSELLQATDYTWPMRFAPLEAYRKQMLLVDGLGNRQGDAGHTVHNLMACVPRANPGDNSLGKAGAKTVDQYVADVIGRDTFFPSLHLGTGESGRLAFGMFAKARGQDMGIRLDPADAFNAVFPNAGMGSGQVISTMGATAPNPRIVLRRKLLDHVREDVKRLQTRLAGEERSKLDQYLGAIDETQRRLATLEQQRPTVAGKVVCGGQPPTVSTMKDNGDEKIAAHVALGSAAIACGLTNVLTVSFLGLGFIPNLANKYGFNPQWSLHDIGHGHGFPIAQDKFISWHGEQVATIIETLSGIKEGDRSIFDNTAILLTSDNAEGHHCKAERWPFALIGTAGGALKADGRYIKYPAIPVGGDAVPREWPPPRGPAGYRSLADFMITLGTAYGANMSGFGQTGLEPVKGPLGEILA